MSNINWLELTFIQLTPIHIGKYNYGIISESRIFIPGYTMWGALVNAYSLENGATDKVYDEAKKKFEYITCFYPFFDNDILFPGFYKGQSCYISNSNKRKYTEQQIRAAFMDTYISTSITPDTKTAKDESLHEIEVFLNKSKYNNKSRDNCINNVIQVYWRGLIGLCDSDYTNYLQKGLEIIVGGDARYGLGRLRLESIKEVGEIELAVWQIDKNGYFRENENPVINYIDIRGVELQKGKVEAVVQLDYTKAVPNAIKDKDEDGFYLCYVPGSIVAVSDNNLFKLKKGILKRES